MTSPTASEVEEVGRAVERVRARIAAAGGDPERVRVVAVTKGQPVAAVRAVLAAGLHDLGESYAQELVAKVEALEEGPAPAAAPRWHAIGRLQRNKVRLIWPHVALWQSVDRLSLAAEIARHAPGAAVLVQVRPHGNEQQGGCRLEAAPGVVAGCRDLGLDVRGLMAIGPQRPAAEVRSAFRAVRALVDRLGLVEASMGMSGDLEAAVAEGSTMVRVGTDLFGARHAGSPVGR